MQIRLETNPALPAMGKRLLSELTSKKLTMDGFLLECAMWMIDALEDMRYRPSPTMPDDVRAYFHKKQDDPGYKLDRSFWDQPHIRIWKAIESEIRALNRSNWYWLNEMNRLIPKDDQVNHAKIQRVMRGYPL